MEDLLLLNLLLISFSSDILGASETPFGMFSGAASELDGISDVDGQCGATVGALRSSINSLTLESDSLAAVDRLQSEIENPGPLRDDSKIPE